MLRFLCERLSVAASFQPHKLWCTWCPAVMKNIRAWYYTPRQILWPWWRSPLLLGESPHIWPCWQPFMYVRAICWFVWLPACRVSRPPFLPDLLKLNRFFGSCSLAGNYFHRTRSHFVNDGRRIHLMLWKDIAAVSTVFLDRGWWSFGSGGLVQRGLWRQNSYDEFEIWGRFHGDMRNIKDMLFVGRVTACSSVCPCEYDNCDDDDDGGWHSSKWHPYVPRWAGIQCCSFMEKQLVNKRVYNKRVL